MDVRNARVLVTGGAGFIGSHLVDRLLDRGNEVIVFDDLSTGSLENHNHHKTNSAFRFLQGDVCDEPTLCKALQGIDAVFHLATRNVRLSLVQPTLVHDVNSTGTLNVLKAAAANGVKRLLYCSSSEVNGTADVVPMPEDYHFRPETVYGASKLVGEYYALVFHRSGWLPTVVARPHNNYGPREHYCGDKGEVIPRFILWALANQPLKIYGSGQQTRDFTYVEETADYLIRLMECDAALGQVVNVCRGDEVSIAELARHICELTDSKSEITHLPGRPSDVLRLFGDPGRLVSLLGSSPGISIRDGLSQTIDWFIREVPRTPSVLSSLEVNTWTHHKAEPWVEAARSHQNRTTAKANTTTQRPTIQLSAPSFSATEVRSLTEVIYSGWVTQGPKVAEFEAAFSRHTGSQYSCAVSNCTAALHLALLGVGVRPGDVVLTPSLSFIATANAIRHCGAEPVFVDVDDTLNLCPDALELLLDKDFERREGRLWYRHVGRLLASESPLRGRNEPRGRLAALLVVHQLGMPCNLPQLAEIASTHGIPIVEDCACAIGSAISPDNGMSWQPIGRPVGEVCCFSFHPRKVITTGDGGMLTTQRPDLDRMFRLWRQHGMSISDAARHGTKAVVLEEYVVTGFNYRLTDLQAAVGLSQLNKLPDILANRRAVAEAYNKALASLPVTLPRESANTKTNWQTYQIQLPSPVWQKQIMQRLLDLGIATRRGVMCAHREVPYRASWPEGSLPNSERLQDTGLILPLHPGLEQADVNRITDALTDALEHSRRNAA